MKLSDAAQRAIADLDRDIEKIQQEIEALERWETTCVTAGGEGGHGGVAGKKSVTRIVGAEVERARLEALLMRRHILTGAS